MPFLKSFSQQVTSSITLLLATSLAVVQVSAAQVSAAQVSAQVVPAVDGTGTIVDLTGQQFTIEGGTTSIDGKNLFHSFQELGLSPEQVANFRSNPNIQNIFSRVIGGNPSIIQGLLKVSNGPSNLFLLNPAGVLFGSTARLELPGSFVATTATGLDFGGGRFGLGHQNYQNLVGTPTGFIFANQQPGAIVNLGQLSLAPGQTLGLLGGMVVNTGSISTIGGQVTIAAIPGSNYLRLSQPGSLLAYDLRPIENAVNLSAKSLPALLTGGSLNLADDLFVNAQGEVQLRQTGTILPTQAGTTIVAGKIDVANPQTVVPASGTVQILGEQVALTNATVDAIGNAQGGNVLIGGDYRGQGQVPNAQRTLVDAGSTIDVSALKQGNGGRAIVWAEGQTDFAGAAIARGGQNLGNGGFIEISGKENLRFTGSTNAVAPQGQSGTILFDPQNIQFKNFAATVLPQPTGVPLFESPNASLDFSPAIFLTNLGNLVFEASNSITIVDPIYTAGQGDITFRAGQQFIASQDILTTGRSILIEAPTIQTTNINTTQFIVGKIPTGNITLRGQNGTLANSITTGALGTVLGQSIQIAGQNITTGDLFTIGLATPSPHVNGLDFLSPSRTLWVGGGGTVSIQGTGDINLQRIRTDQGSIKINASSSSFDGVVTTNYLAPLGGNVEIKARSVDLGPIGTGPYSSTSRGGNITVSTQLDLTTTSVDATGGNGFAGNITLNSQQGNVNVGTIIALGEKGGNVNLQGDKVRVTETWNGGPSSINVPGKVQITHRGGPDNQSFRIGYPNVDNGTAGAIEVRSGALLEKEVIPIQPNPTTFRTPDGKIQITSQNTSPNLPIDRKPILTVIPQTLVRFTLADLGFRSPVDAEGDAVQLILRDKRLPGENSGQLLINGQKVMNPNIPIGLNDVLTFEAINQLNPKAPFFEVVAADLNLIARPELVNAYPAEAIRLRTGPISPSPPILQPGPSIPAQLPSLPTGGQGMLALDTNLNLPSASKIRTFDLEKQLAQEFSQGLNLPAVQGDTTSPISLMQQIAGITGVKPALIYISFLSQTQNASSSRSRDPLELTLVTAKGVTRHRVESVDRAAFQAVVTNFRREVTNPIRTNTKTYLPTAQQLYQWIIAPLLPELSQQQITNLVFLPESGARAIPFAALHDGKGFLVEKFSVSLMPSLTLTDTRYRDLRNAGVLAIGVSESTQGQPSLPTVPTEIDTVLKLWQGGDRLLNQQVTIDNLKQARKGKPYGIVHLATHANFVTNSKENSYIQLWNQQLQLEQIHQLAWNNPPVDLLVLSACRTALGDAQSELGFAGLALQTGVKTTLASLWYVSDAATTALMSDFYHQLRTSPIKAEALRQAQLNMIQGKVRLSEAGVVGIAGIPTIALPEDTVIPNYNLDHPYYWAAFSMVGNPW